MMDLSDRSEYVGANVTPDVKRTLQDYVKSQRENGNSISVSRWVEEAILMRLEKEGIPVVSLNEGYVGEELPFEETT